MSPCNRDPALETYVRAVRDDIQPSLNQGPKYHPHDNLTSQERKALLSLRSRSDIVVKSADKGSVTVVMSRWDYLERIMSHLQNKEFYCRLDENPTDRYAEEITSFLKT